MPAPIGSFLCFLVSSFAKVSADFQKYSENNENNLCRVLTDEIESCVKNYSIKVVPTVIFFKNGKIAKRLNGIAGIGLNEKQLVEMIDSCKISEDLN